MLNLLATLAAWNVWAFAAIMLAAQLGAREAGFVVGTRVRQRGADPEEGAGLIVGSILGLLAFILALTLSSAATLETNRRDGSLAEANAIRTAWLHAGAIQDPRGQAVASTLVEYNGLRREYVALTRGSPRIEDVTARTGELQAAIWADVSALDRDGAGAESLVAAVTDLFAATSQLRFAMQYSLSAPLVFLLLVVTVIGMGAVGYQLGLMRKPERTVSVVMSLIWTGVMVLILDMGFARIGSAGADDFAYAWTADAIGAE